MSTICAMLRSSWSAANAPRRLMRVSTLARNRTATPRKTTFWMAWEDCRKPANSSHRGASRRWSSASSATNTMIAISAQVAMRRGRLGRRRSAARAIDSLAASSRSLDTRSSPEPGNRSPMRLRQRIGERFPGSGLERVSRDLLDAASESMARAADLRRPNLPLRIATWALIAIIVFVALEALLHLRLAPRWEEFAGFLQSSQAIQNVVFLGVAVLFLANVETRIKRRGALAALHELRSIAHIVDMHQLTKDPDQLLGEGATTATSPQGTMTRFALSRYLDYCSELLSLTSKVAALYVQDSQDPVLLDAVNDVETLTTGLSRKIWQKIMIIDTLEPSRRLT